MDSCGKKIKKNTAISRISFLLLFLGLWAVPSSGPGNTIGSDIKPLLSVNQGGQNVEKNIDKTVAQIPSSAYGVSSKNSNTKTNTPSLGQEEKKENFDILKSNITHLTLANGVRFSIAGGALLNAFWVNQTEIYSNIYQGKGLDKLYDLSHNMWPTHDQDFMFAVNNGKLDFNITGGSIEECQYAFHTIFGIGNKLLKQCFLILENQETGALILGNTSGAEIRLLNSPVDELVATGGVNGAFSTVINMTTWCDMSANMAGTTGSATKITYITPRIKGFKGGISFTPDSDHFWDSPMETSFSNNTNRDAGKIFGLNVVTATANYSYVKDTISCDLSASVLAGNCRPERPDKDLLDRFPYRSLDIGVVLGYRPEDQTGRYFFGVEYIYNGKSGLFSTDDEGQGYQDASGNMDPTKGIIPVLDNQLLAPKKYTASLAGNAWIGIVGLGYNDRKNFGVSLSYLHSQKNTGFTDLDSLNEKSDKAIGNAYVLSFEYYIRPGLSWYVELGYYSMSNPDADYIGHKIASTDNWKFTTVDSNEATAIITGIKLNF